MTHHPPPAKYWPRNLTNGTSNQDDIKYKVGWNMYLADEIDVLHGYITQGYYNAMRSDSQRRFTKEQRDDAKRWLKIWRELNSY